MALVSIIIPTYNGEKYIVETLNSIISQSWNDWEIILVIDGSKDNTLEIVKDIDSRITIINQENKGIAEARNSGLRHATGQYIAFCDHDDIWHPEKLSAQLFCFKQNPSAGAIYGDFTRWEGEKSQKDCFFQYKLNPALIDEDFSGWIYHKLIMTNWVLFSSLMLKTDVTDDIGWFDPELPPSDDWDYIIRVSQKYEICKIKQSIVLYRSYAEQTSKKIRKINTEVEFREKTINKYGLQCKNGKKINEDEIRFRFYRSHYNFGLSHYYEGDATIALKSFLKALKFKPLNYKTYIYLFLSIIKSVIKII